MALKSVESQKCFAPPTITINNQITNSHAIEQREKDVLHYRLKGKQPEEPFNGRTVR